MKRPIEFLGQISERDGYWFARITVVNRKTKKTGVFEYTEIFSSEELAINAIKDLLPYSTDIVRISESTTEDFYIH